MKKRISARAVRIAALAVLWGAVLLFWGLKMQRIVWVPLLSFMNHLFVFLVPVLSVAFLGGRRLLGQDGFSLKRVGALLAGNGLLVAGGICFVYCTIQLPGIRAARGDGAVFEPPFYLRGVPVEAMGPIAAAIIWVLIFGFAVLGVAAGILLLKNGLLLPLLFVNSGAVAYCVFAVWGLSMMGSPERYEAVSRMGAQSLLWSVGVGLLCLAVLLWLRRKHVGRADGARVLCMRR